MPKFNDLFIKFFKICDKSLAKALIIIIIINFIFEYFSLRFHYVKIVIFFKLKKTSKILYILKIYKFIALFNFINKIIEKIINKHIIVIIEKYDLFS
jgi:hypothetical protein